MDISGAQYGIHQTLWRWEEYAQEHVARAREVLVMGTNKARLKVLSQIPGNPSLNYGLVGFVADHLDEAIRKWNADNGLSLADLLDLNKERYEQASSELLQVMNVAVRDYINTHDFKAEFEVAQTYERSHSGESGKMVRETNKAFSARVATAMTGHITNPAAKHYIV